MRLALGATMIFVSLLGCGGSDDAPDAKPPKAATPKGDLHELVGDFQVRLTPDNASTGASARTSVFGSVKDGPDPSAIAWHVTAEAGDCTLSEPEAPFCSTPCGGGAVCTAQDECTPYPSARDVGTIRLHGIGDESLRIEPIAGKYTPSGASVPYPPCAEGDAVTLEATGGSYPSFERQTRCIAPLEFAGGLAIERGRALELQWEPPGDAELARIGVSIDISHHGGAKGKIECDTADSGAISVDAALIDRLVELGVAGFPTVSLTRASKSEETDEPRAIALSMLETVEQPLEIPGLKSCTDDRQCPPGQQCGSDLVCKTH